MKQQLLFTRLKGILPWLVLSLTSCTLQAQPGPTYTNLNQGVFGIIVIDSTTDLSRIGLLKSFDHLQLDLFLDSIPTQFEGFDKLTSLSIGSYKCLKDLSGLRYFKNLQWLSISGFNGSVLSATPLRLDSLKHLELHNSMQLKNLDALAELKALEVLNVHDEHITAFPKFARGNHLKKLRIERYAYVSDSTTKKPFDLHNLRYLGRLEDLYLGSMLQLTEVPPDLPGALKKLEISGAGVHPWQGEKITLSSIKNIKKYPHLTFFTLYGVWLAKIDGDFKGMSLGRLDLNTIYGLEDVSGLFSFDSIAELSMRRCHDLKQISASACRLRTHKLLVEESGRLRDVNFLFGCEGISRLEIKDAPELIVPDTAMMEKIPDIILYGSGPRHFQLYKEKGSWKILNYPGKAGDGK